MTSFLGLSSPAGYSSHDYDYYDSSFVDDFIDVSTTSDTTPATTPRHIQFNNSPPSG